MPVSRRQMLGVLAGAGVGGFGGCSDLASDPADTPTFVTPNRSPRPSPVEPHPDACGPPSTTTPGDATLLSATAVEPTEIGRCSRVAVLGEQARDLVVDAVEHGDALIADSTLSTRETPPVAAFPYVEIGGAIYEPSHDTDGISGPRIIELGDPHDRRPLTGNIVKYDDLSRSDKQIASRAIQQGRVTLGHHDPSDAWARRADYLAYGGEYYPISTPKSTGDFFPHHHVSMRPLREDLPDDAVVVRVRTAVPTDVSEALTVVAEQGEKVESPPEVARFVRRYPYAMTLSTLYRLQLD